MFRIEMDASFRECGEQAFQGLLGCRGREPCFLETVLSMTEREVNESRVVDVMIYRKRGRDPQNISFAIGGRARFEVWRVWKSYL